MAAAIFQAALDFGGMQARAEMLLSSLSAIFAQASLSAAAQAAP
jgi:hypothetical protein